MYDLINVMVPTYKRPEKIRMFIDSALSCASSPSNLRFTFCINKKDEATEESINARYWPVKDQFCFVKEETEQPNLSLYFNMMYDETKFNNPSTLISMFGDDMIFRSKDWDEKFFDAADKFNGECILYGDDAFIAHEKLCVHFVTTRKMVEASKKPFMCPLFHADMIDVIWYNVGQFTQTLHYYPEIVIQHAHSTMFHQSKWDDTFQRLVPLQQAANQPKNQKLAMMYSHQCARNIIEAGIGKWNTL